VALPNTDYLRAMIDWCKEFRGYKSDGTINLCWDIINYHLYTNDPALNRGVAPEKTGAGNRADSIASNFINVAHQYANGMPVWVTEAGYDINEFSPNKAIAIGTKTVLQTQADWILRTALLYARNGIEQLYFYQLQDDNPLSGSLYGTSGLINQNLSPRPAADFIKQTNQLFGKYSYDKTLSTDPIVDRYSLGDSLLYVVYVPDETGRRSRYFLNLNNADSAIVYRPVAGRKNMSTNKIKTNNGILTLTATETPVFVTGIAKKVDQQVSTNLKLYPNPATNTVTIDGLAHGIRSQVVLINSDGNPLKMLTSFATQISVDISAIVPATYFMVIKTGGQQTILPFIKMK
jgi:endoglucanase